MLLVANVPARHGKNTHRVGFRDRVFRFAEDRKKVPKILVGDRNLAAVGSNNEGGVVECVAEEGLHVDLVLLTDEPDDLVVFHGLVAHLGGLKGQLRHVPLLEDLRKDERRLANKDIETSVVRLLLEAVVQIAQGLDQEPPDVDSGSAVVVGVEPRVDYEDHFEELTASDGVSEGGVVMEPQTVQTKPVHSGGGMNRLGVCYFLLE